MPKKQSHNTSTKNVSFRIAPELFELLENYASGLKDDMGQPLTAPMAARRIVVQTLQKMKKSLPPSNSPKTNYLENL